MIFATVFTKYLTDYDRQKLCLFLVCLNIVQIHFAIAGFCFGAYISLSVNCKAHLAKGYSLKPVGGAISGCSIVLFLFHCIGAKVSSDCGYRRTRHHCQNKLFVIVIAHVFMSCIILSVSMFCVVQYFKLKRDLRHGLVHSMYFYSKIKNTKREIDEIQIDYKCCGSLNYTDWFKVKWLSKEDLPPENDKVFSRWQYLHSVPFSCCDPSTLAPCFHRQVTVKRGQYKYPHHGFYKRGCTEVLLEVLQEVLLAAASLILLPFFLELTIAVQSRYLQTSLEDSTRRRNPNGAGACWLFKKSSYESYFLFKENTVHDIPDSFSSSSDELTSNESEVKRPLPKNGAKITKQKKADDK